jgi:glycerol-3-phosphate dehydrogenase
MAAYTITTHGNSVLFCVDGKKKRTGSKPTISPAGNDTDVVFVVPEWERLILRTTDSYIINGVPFVPLDVDDLIDKLYSLFQEADTGTSGTGDISTAVLNGGYF